MPSRRKQSRPRHVDDELSGTPGDEQREDIDDDCDETSSLQQQTVDDNLEQSAAANTVHAVDTYTATTNSVESAIRRQTSYLSMLARRHQTRNITATSSDEYDINNIDNEDDDVMCNDKQPDTSILKRHLADDDDDDDDDDDEDNDDEMFDQNDEDDELNRTTIHNDKAVPAPTPVIMSSHQWPPLHFQLPSRPINKLMPPFLQFPGGPVPSTGLQRDSNVKLAAIDGTDVAVAQFTENNLLPAADMAALNVVLWNLHQQQMFQMHLLLQLQQQVVIATASTTKNHLNNNNITNTANSNEMSASRSPPATLNTNDAVSLVNSSVLQQVDIQSSHPLHQPTQPTSKYIEDARSSVVPDDKLSASTSSAITTQSTANSLMTSSTSQQHQQFVDTSKNINTSNEYITGPCSSIGSIPPMLAMIDMSLSRLEQQHKQSTEAVKAATSAAQSNGRGYRGSSDEPYYKHRCRYCQKGFSSDSALQIHIRSHTGERPYKCGVCGNRFSTKGNLKVHSMCHTQKYPPQIHFEPPPSQQSVHPHAAPYRPTPDLPSEVTNTNNIFHSRPPPMLVPINSLPPPANLFPSSSGSFSISSSSSSSLKAENTSVLMTSPGTVRQESTDNRSEVVRSSLYSPAVTSSHDVITSRSPSDKMTSSDRPSSQHSASIVSPTGKNNFIPLPSGLPPFPLIAPASSVSASHVPPVPPPPLSMLSSMSSSLEAFPNSAPFSTGSFGGLFRSINGTVSVPQLHMPPNTVSTPHPPGHPPPPFGFDPAQLYFAGTPHISAPASVTGANGRNSKIEDPLEQFMEIQKSSETSKMEQLVRSIDKKLTDPNQCVVCMRTLSCKSALQMHYRTHTGERPFRCKICGRAFTTKGNLKTHMGVHRAKPPIRALHACRVCHKQFTNALVLQQHLRAHIGSTGPPAVQTGGPTVSGPPQTTLHNELLPTQCSFNSPTTQQPQPAPPQTPGNVMMMSAAAVAAAAAMSYMPFAAVAGYPFFPAAPGFPPPRQPLVRFPLDNRPPPFMEELRRTATCVDDNDDDDNDDDGGDYRNNDDKRQGISDDDNDDIKLVSDDIELDDDDDDVDDDEQSDDNIIETDDDKCERVEDYQQQYSKDEQQLITASYENENLHSNDIENTNNKYLSVNEESQSMRYSTSLMALEEKVNEMNTRHEKVIKDGVSSHPLEQMERIIQRTEVSQQSTTYNSHNTVEQQTSSTVNINETTIRSKPTVDLQSLQRSVATLDAINLSPTAFEAATGRPNTTCTICYKTFACRSALDIHYRSHTKERPFKCHVCDRAFSTKGNMKQHVLTHKAGNETGDNIERTIHSQNSSSMFTSDGSCSSSLSFPACSDDYNNIDNIGHASHSNDHCSSPPDRIISSPSLIPTQSTPSTMIIQTVPSIDDSENSPSSPTRQSIQAMTSQSLRPSSPSSRRPVNLRHICQVCQKPFSSASALQIHMRTHTGDKPFRCEVCGKAFTTKGNLKVHMGTHVWNSIPSRRGRRMSVDGIHSSSTSSLTIDDQQTVKCPPVPPSDYFLPNAAQSTQIQPTPPNQRIPPGPAALYPFQFPFGANGFAVSNPGGVGNAGTLMTPTSRLNEISVIQNRMLHHQMVAGAGGPPGPPSNPMLDMMSRLPPGLSALVNPQQAYAAVAAMRFPFPLPPMPPPKTPASDVTGNLIQANNNNNGGLEKTGHCGELDLSVKKSQHLQSTFNRSSSPFSATKSDISDPTTSPSSIKPSSSTTVGPSWLPSAWKSSCGICREVCLSPASLEHHIKTIHPTDWTAAAALYHHRQQQQDAGVNNTIIALSQLS